MTERLTHAHTPHCFEHPQYGVPHAAPNEINPSGRTMGFFSPPDPALSGQKPCATAAELGTETCFYQSDTLAL